ncbi:alpha/beta hydrolase [Paenalcaligenes niemegkensis]|uniref:alpha/beta fold hydrolase n=1 Tax=Paenalcaligenes niemegkensis TaxID=2895469 RepID=UPI001EE8F924|nr:alpha/beta hydrolase [Paenalcaligenes niemegkensis]MCQ9615317.1 alpha/beta hydrolase [Paenalcaligenes niemegkensis]
MLKEHSVHGVPVFYEELGSGSPLVLLHGSLCDYRYWRLQLKILSQNYRVIAPSLPGYWPALNLDRFSTHLQAETIQNLLADIAPSERYHLLGHSRGAQAALQIAINRPEQLRSLSLADPGFKLPDDENSSIFDKVLPLLERGQTDAALALFVDTVNGPATWQQMVSWFKIMVRDNAPTLFKQAQESGFLLSLDALKLDNCPVLLINGQHSPIRYKQRIAALKKQAPHAYEVTIAHAAHGMNLANPKAFNQSVLRFLTAVDNKTAKYAI